MRKITICILLLLVTLIAGCASKQPMFTYETDALYPPLDPNACLITSCESIGTVIEITGCSDPDKDLVIPEYYDGYQVKRIGNNCFEKSNIETLSVQNVSGIAAYSFRACQSLRSVQLEGVEWIGNCAFADCDSLTEIILPDTLVSLTLGVFGGCDNLETVIFQSNPNIVGDPFMQYGDRLPLTIYGIPGGSVEEYARENGYTFIDIALWDQSK